MRVSTEVLIGCGLEADHAHPSFEMILRYAVQDVSRLVPS